MKTKELIEYINLQVGQFLQILDKIKSRTHIVQITDSPMQQYKHIIETSFLEYAGTNMRKREITHKEFNEVKLEKLDGMGPSKEFPINLLQEHFKEEKQFSLHSSCKHTTALFNNVKNIGKKPQNFMKLCLHREYFKLKIRRF